MKIWRLALAALLAAGTVTAYVYFPNPIERVSRSEPAAHASPDARPAGRTGSN